MEINSWRLERIYSVLEQFEDRSLSTFDLSFFNDATVFLINLLTGPFITLFSTTENNIGNDLNSENIRVKFFISIIDSVFIFYFVFFTLFYLFLRFNSSLFATVYANYYFKLVEALKTLLIAQAGRRAQPFLPLLLTLFIFILLGNLFGLIPFFFCLTGQFFFTILLSFSIFFGLTLFGFKFQSYRFLALFVPQNVPAFLLPFLILIEIISYLSRAISLAVRLFANMVAGHVLLHILMGLCLVILKGAKNLLILPIIIIFLTVLCAILFLEFGISFLQAYVFVVLCAIYLNDSLNIKAH